MGSSPLSLLISSISPHDLVTFSGLAVGSGAIAGAGMCTIRVRVSASAFLPRPSLRCQRDIPIVDDVLESSVLFSLVLLDDFSRFHTGVVRIMVEGFCLMCRVSDGSIRSMISLRKCDVKFVGNGRAF